MMVRGTERVTLTRAPGCDFLLTLVTMTLTAMNHQGNGSMGQGVM
jgi:hypothetical protein